jgi:hypothetical protein
MTLREDAQWRRAAKKNEALLIFMSLLLLIATVSLGYYYPLLRRVFEQSSTAGEYEISHLLVVFIGISICMAMTVGSLIPLVIAYIERGLSYSRQTANAFKVLSSCLLGFWIVGGLANSYITYQKSIKYGFAWVLSHPERFFRFNETIGIGCVVIIFCSAMALHQQKSARISTLMALSSALLSALSQYIPRELSYLYGAFAYLLVACFLLLAGGGQTAGDGPEKAQA